MVPSSEESQPYRRRWRQGAMRAGPGILVCPRCRIPLEGADHELGIAWRCRGCGGQSLNFSQFRRMVPEHGANDIWLRAATRPDLPREPADCPECQGQMDAVLIPFRGGQVELNICRACQRLWLDRQESAQFTGSLALVPSGRGKNGRKSRKEQAEAMMGALERQDDLRQEQTSQHRRWRLDVIGAITGVVVYFVAAEVDEVWNRVLLASLVAGLCWAAGIAWSRRTERKDNPER